jgi:hypothetical protein
MRDRIHEVLRKRSEESELNSYLFSAREEDEVAVQYWRDGLRERTERNPLRAKPESKPAIEAFDGVHIRRLGYSERSNSWVGQIVSTSNAGRNVENRRTPFSFLFEFINTPYSDIIRDATSCDSELVTILGKKHTKLTVRPKEKYFPDFELIFDDQHRLVERTLTYISAPTSKANARKWGQRQSFGDYRQHILPSGERLWFPWTVTYQEYMGELEDGSRAEHVGWRFQLENVSFNEEYPDDLFLIGFPEGSRIFDGVSLMGWIGEDDKPPQPFDNDASDRFYLLLGINVSVLIIIASITVFRRLRARRRIA